MKSLDIKTGPCSWASCPQLCFVRGLHSKPPVGPRGAAAGEPEGQQETGIVLGLNPCLNSRASVNQGLGYLPLLVDVEIRELGKFLSQCLLLVHDGYFKYWFS